MTPIEFQRKLEAKVADLNTAKLIFPIAQEAQRMLIKRLFDEGRGGDTSRLGTYSTEPAYFTKKQFKNTSAFKPQGKVKTGTKTSKEGTNYTTVSYKTKSGKVRTKKVAIKSDFTERTSMYLDEGYKELKQIQGYESSFVNLTYSSDLRNDASTGMAIKGDKVVAVLKRKINADKVEWLSDKYGDKTFKHTQEEKDFFRTEVSEALVNYMTA